MARVLLVLSFASLAALAALSTARSFEAIEGGLWFVFTLGGLLCLGVILGALSFFYYAEDKFEAEQDALRDFRDPTLE